MLSGNRRRSSSKPAITSRHSLLLKAQNSRNRPSGRYRVQASHGISFQGRRYVSPGLTDRLRGQEVDIYYDRRDTIANVLHASVFLTFHAGDFGAASPRAAVYSFEPPAPSEESSLPGPAGMPRLIPWEYVQVFELDRSRELAGALQQSLAAIPGLSVPKAAAAPARVLRSVGNPAAAVEIGSFAPDLDSAPLSALSFQQQLADAILKGLDAFKKP